MPRHTIAGPAGRLEATSRLPEQTQNPRTGRALVVAHPHPLYGGNMDNPVVLAAARGATQLGVPALRFNFRGTGASEGTHDNGVGEVDDLLAASDYARQEFDAERLWLAGYSFGAATILRARNLSESIAGLLLIAPPLSMHDFASEPVVQSAAAGKGPRAATIYGARDDFTAAPTRSQLAALSPVFEAELPNAGHDLGTATGSLAPLQTAINGALERLGLGAN